MIAKHSLCMYFIYVGLLQFQTVQTGNVCFECKQVDNPDDCKIFHTCDEGENCYHEVIEAEDGSAKYSWGCASPQLCTLEMNLSYRPKRLGLQKCFKCCDYNFCNFGTCKRDFCGSVTCRNNATCTNTPLGHFCNCSVGYMGTFCEQEIDECSSDPCRNGATCTDYIGYYMCTCLPGYTGTNCELDINECMSNPCAANSTCVDHIDGFTCDCSPGFTGTYCEIDIDECESTPCRYNSTCIDLVDGYVCDCIPGITGTNCEINIDDCENVTCFNNATCQDYVDSFQCLCQFGFTGVYCDTSLGRVCYDCEDGVDDPSNCTNKVICGQNQECYTEHELTLVGVIKHNLGCVTRDMCTYYENLGIARLKRSKAIQLCYECCDENGCNHHACVEPRSLDLWSV